MNILFIRKKKYYINTSIENVRSEIEALVNRKWSDFSKNISGRIVNNDTFKFNHKWSFVHFYWIERSPAYLSVILSDNGERTILETSIRPNSLFVIFFYLITILFLCEVFGINTIVNGDRVLKIALFFLFSVIIFLLMLYFTNGLRNRFERLIDLKR